MSEPEKTSMVLWCRVCDTGFGSTGWLPDLCPECHEEPHWTTIPPWKLTHNDRRLLKMFHIAHEDGGNR